MKIILSLLFLLLPSFGFSQSLELGLASPIGRNAAESKNQEKTIQADYIYKDNLTLGLSYYKQTDNGHSQRESSVIDKYYGITGRVFYNGVRKNSFFFGLTSGIAERTFTYETVRLRTQNAFWALELGYRIAVGQHFAINAGISHYISYTPQTAYVTYVDSSGKLQFDMVDSRIVLPIKLSATVLF